MPNYLRKIPIGVLRGTQFGNYIESLNYVDRTLKNFFDLMKSKGKLEKTLFVVFGDHDAMLKMTEKEISLARGVVNLNDVQLTEIQARSFTYNKVPVLIFASDLEGQREIEKIGGQIDIAPTVLHLLGIEPPLSFLGESLLMSKDSAFAVRLGKEVANSSLVYSEVGENNSCSEKVGGAELSERSCAMLRSLGVNQFSNSNTIVLNDLAREISDHP